MRLRNRTRAVFRQVPYMRQVREKINFFCRLEVGRVCQVRKVRGKSAYYSWQAFLLITNSSTALSW